MTQALDVRVPVTLGRDPLVIRRILVALDGTRFAERALPVACGLARASHAEVVLIHIGAGHPRTDHPARRLWPIPRHPHDNVHAMSLYLARQESAMREQGVRARSRLVRVGSDDISGALLRTCEQMGADILVLATHAGPGSKTFARSGLPLASAILRDAALPVLLVDSATTNPFAIAEGKGMTLLVPLRPDTTIEHHGGLDWATTLARLCTGQVAVLLAAEGDVATREALNSSAQPRAPHTVDTHTARRGALAQIEQVRTAWSASDVPIWATLTRGNLMTEVARQAHRRADLIVVPMLRGEGVSGRIHEAFGLLRMSNVPVLLVPDTTPAASSPGRTCAARCVEEAIHGVGPSW